MYFITTKRMLEVCFFQHTPTFIIEPKYKNVGSFNLLPIFFAENVDFCSQPGRC